MIRRHSLSDPDKGVAIFAQSAEKDIRNLDATQSRAALTAMINCLESRVPESVIEKTYETCEELQQLRQGDLRIYVYLFTEIPVYNILWVFAIRQHRYRNLGKFDAKACEKVNDIGDFTTKREVEDCIEANDALTVDDLKELRAEI